MGIFAMPTLFMMSIDGSATAERVCRSEMGSRDQER